MNINDLLKRLEIEEAEGFVYFENFADVMEMDEEIPPETYYQLIVNTPPDTIAELSASYIDDLLENLPEDQTELYTLLYTIRMMLHGFGKYAREERNVVTFADELFRFRQWFRFESQVRCEGKNGVKYKVMPIFEAILLYRSNQFDNVNPIEYEFDFEECLDYPLDEYVVSFSHYGLPDQDEEAEEE